MYADVLVQYGAKTLDRTFTYHIPDSLIDDVKVGMKVYVPFGAQKINGFVVAINDDKPNKETKDIIAIVTKDFVLNSELMELGKYIQEKTLCSLITAYQAMLPTALKVNNSKEDYNLYKNYVYLSASLTDVDTYILHNMRSKRQIEILESLKNGPLLKKDIPSSSLEKLLAVGLVKCRKESVYRINPVCTDAKKRELIDEQNVAFDAVVSKKNEYGVFLLHGVTGSGKTEVYMHLVAEVLKDGKRAIVLVPEISLTTQIVKRFYERFGEQVAIFHSNLSDGEKYDEYKKIMNDEVSIVVGTRSAIFTPLKNIGIIIIDEEHSSNYKQENNPRYNAIDIAKWRASYHKCPVILGSATPSLESMARAMKGVYNYLSLQNRIGNAKLPTIHIVDMASEYKKRNMILSDFLKEKIMGCLERGEQIMLLLNRRGYSTIMMCQSCGYTYKCPHCDITLTYHKSSNHLRCHYCGYTTFNSEICPECHERAIRDYGLGTEKVESYIKELYPSYRVVRMDTDTTSRKGSYEKIITNIENHEYDIIIGTQMISKGFDFPLVTLVGIINADESLNIPDFRSGENTFSLLSQVSGRAGRHDLPGEVVIQTFNPDNKTLRYVQKNDYLGNYKYEMNLRKQLRYPPYYYLVGIKVLSKNYETASKEATKIANYLRNNISASSICLGPTTARMFRINNVYRFQLIVKYRQDDKLMDSLKYIDSEYVFNKDVNLEIDIDPLHI